MQETVNYPANWLPRLLRVWALFALVTLGVMLLHQSDDPILLNRYSTLVTLQLGGLLLLVLALWGAGMYLQRRPSHLERLQQQLTTVREQRGFVPAVIVVGSLLPAAVWLFFLGNHLPTYGFLRLFAASSIIITVLALFYGGTGALPAVNSRRGMLLLGFVVAGCAIFAVATAGFYPALAKTDEAFVFSMGRNALENGHYRPLIYRQAFPEYYYGGIWTWMMAVWMRVAGVSLTSGRLYVSFLSAICVTLLTLAANRLYSRKTALCVVLVGTYAFISLNHIRFDIHTAFWLSVGIFFYSLARTTGKWWAHFLTGLAVGICIDSNPISYCFGLGLAVVYGYEYIQVIRRERRRSWPPFWFMAFGGIVALGIYLTIHAGGSFAGGQTTGGLLSDYTGFLRDGLATGQFISLLEQYFSAFLTNQPVLFGLMVLGLIATLHDRTPSDRFLFILYFVWMAIIVFAYFYFPRFYIMLGLPVFVMLAGRGLARGIPLLLGYNSDEQTTRLTWASLLLATIWFTTSTAYNFIELPTQSLEDVVQAGEQIGDMTPNDAVIVGAEPYAFGLIDHPNFVGGAIESMLINFQGLSAGEAWATVAPDALIFSADGPTEPERTPALLRYMDENAFGLRACFLTVNFGRVELWTRDTANTQTDATCTPVCNPRTNCL